MTCSDCGKDVAEADTPSGMTTCVSCRLKQLKHMPIVRFVVRHLRGRVVAAMSRKQLEGTWDFGKDGDE